ncbi:MAG: hypothetical protein K0R90_94 [Oscillospiraceae bacterium]|jgi:lysophospholipase L1-like esterase|nr:hypothetical protein [Oscillospiraceae bacterium]
MKLIKRKRYCSVALSIILLLVFFVNSTFAVAPTDVNTSLTDQIQNAENGGVIILTKNYTEEIVIKANQEVTIDLNGFTLTCDTSTVITNNGILTIKDSIGTGKIKKAGTNSDTCGILNNGALTVASGTIDISTATDGVAYGINNKGHLSVTGGNITASTTGDKWAISIYNTGTITQISGGSITGKINKASNINNALGVSNESGAVITLVSGGTISAEVNNEGMAYGIRNRGTVQEIKNGKIAALTTGAKWAFAFWNTDTGTVSKISGGTIAGTISNSGNVNNALGVSNEGTIDSITGGTFTGKINGSGVAYGIRSDKTISQISGGAYKGNTADNAIYKRGGTLTFASGYSLASQNAGLPRYVMASGSSYVQLCDEQENWVATYIYDVSGALVNALGDNAEQSYTVYNWKQDQSGETTVCTAASFNNIKTNTTLYVKRNTADRPVYYFLGSSVTYGEANHGVSFVDYMAETNNWICMKKAVSGTTLVNNGADSYVQRMRNQIGINAPVDHFVCQLSTNDASQNKPLGTVSSSKKLEDFNTTTIIGAMEYIIAYSYQTWECPVTFYTNPYYNNAAYEQMINALYKLQEKWDIGIVDFYNYKNMDALPSATLNSYMADSIHPNANGYKWMAQIMGKYLTDYTDPTDPTDPGNSSNPDSSAPDSSTPDDSSTPSSSDNSSDSISSDDSSSPSHNSIDSSDLDDTNNSNSSEDSPQTGSSLNFLWGIMLIASIMTIISLCMRRVYLTSRR